MDGKSGPVSPDIWTKWGMALVMSLAAPTDYAFVPLFKLYLQHVLFVNSNCKMVSKAQLLFFYRADRSVDHFFYSIQSEVTLLITLASYSG